MLVMFDAGAVEAEVVGVGAAANGEEDVGSDAVRRVVGAVDAGGYIVAARLKVNALGAGSNGNAFFFKEGLDGGGDVLIFARDQARGLLDDGDFAAEAAKDLSEFEADVAAAYDDEMAGQSFELEDAYVVHPRDAIDSGKIGDYGASSDVDEDFF